jgi:hypothetical protein
MAKREGLAVRRRGNRLGVMASAPDEWGIPARNPPGSYSRGSVPYKGRRDATEVRHLDLLNAVLDGRGWTDAQLAVVLGVHNDRILRWRAYGVPNLYVFGLRVLVNRSSPEGPGIAKPSQRAVGIASCRLFEVDNK